MQDAQIPCFFPIWENQLNESSKYRWQAQIADGALPCRWERLVCPEVLARRPGNGVEGRVHMRLIERQTHPQRKKERKKERDK
ncbi:hypothetical protein BO79DRAFT_59431 [Aspergillus costaricaensis CBS 115574]|uniref:Uncharacterized protein n=1 Tax=Aspergillus costaricaensis CBS 115574 TaxID=1448317 RepID=A0ACD1I1U2_9EURO|nr:hypothetical protein BO79DRAFT_59431 [Aspergillus costaricaensis CBS 115574]RAK84230.1 hypothetical protein BO79DRAFT_59431 [Aspergillus costaricaensis CBS 115574]